MELILASSSSRRQDLLEEAGILFRVDAPLVDEFDSHSRPELSPLDLALANALLKAETVALRHPQGIILAADTIVVCDGRTLGKPLDLTEAHQMLRWLSGKTHEVITAVVWLRVQEKILHEHIARTRVTFRPLDDAAIQNYLGKVHVLDKAGAYAYQEHGHEVVERVEGSKTNVIGLPMEIVQHWWSTLR
ncbi:MAG: septum formation protein Maf [Blastochloris sp.]|nr:septum formation protein Maf [Blastochloris sp.]